MALPRLALRVAGTVLLLALGSAAPAAAGDQPFNVQTCTASCYQRRAQEPALARQCAQRCMFWTLSGMVYLSGRSQEEWDDACDPLGVSGAAARARASCGIRYRGALIPRGSSTGR